MMQILRPPAVAFDAIAPSFDARFNPWKSVAAQRRAVRSALLRAFPQRGHILEVGGGTGEDAAYLAEQGFEVFLTDASPAMVSVASTKLVPRGGHTAVVAGEEMEIFAELHLSRGGNRFDGAFSNFAPLNCVRDLLPTARGLARLLKPGAPLLLGIFGTLCPGEILTEILRGRLHLALRRFLRGEVPARLARREFSVFYHRRKDMVRNFAPWFSLEERLGIGVTVPPSAAEPWISRHTRILETMEALDRVLARPLAIFGDHILYRFRRTSADIGTDTATNLNANNRMTRVRHCGDTEREAESQAR